MVNVFKSLVILQAEVALLPQEDKFDGLRTALADLVDGILNLPEYDEVEVCENSINIQDVFKNHKLPQRPDYYLGGK